MASSPIPPDDSDSGREGLGARRAGWHVRGGGKSSMREDEALSDPLMDRNEARRDRSVWRRSRRARMLASIRDGGPLGFLPRSPVARMLMVIAALLLLVLVSATARAAVGKDGFVAVPPYSARVTDSAGMLTASQRSALEGVLADYESRSGSQIAVLLVPSTAPESIEQYGIRVAEAWKLGRKGVDDGVLLLVAKDNPSALRRLRIEAGRGVQGSLTDAQSKRVLQDVIAPHFRQGDYYGGLAAGVSAIATLIDKERLPAPPGASGRAATQAQPGAVQGGTATGAAAGAATGAAAGAATGTSTAAANNAGLGRLADAAGAGAIGAPGAARGTAAGDGRGAAAGGNTGGDAATRPGATGDSAARTGAAGGDAPARGGVAGSGGGGIGWFFPLVLIVAGFFLLRGFGRGRRSLHRGGWGSDASGVLLGAALGHAMGSARGWGHGGYSGGGFGGGGGGFGGGGFSGGGGTFDGGGASGDW